MIIRLDESTPKLALRIIQPGRHGKQLADRNIIMRVSPLGCPRPIGHHYELRPVCGTVSVPDYDIPPSIDYPAFEVDDDCNVVFYFDDKMWELPPGRYLGELLIDGCAETTIHIALNNRPVLIDRASLISATPCSNDCDL